MATQEDRSVGAGITIPNWMKNKMNTKFDFDQSAFSPTELDDSFMFYYRHPPPKSIKEMESKMIASNLPENINVTAISKKDQDFSRHPTPCQKYLQNIVDVGPPPQTTPQMKLKPSGTDDGFKGEAAKCGSSIIRVANQMVAGKVFHGITLGEKDKCEEGQQQPTYDLMQRRGSRSLPASPLSSPHGSPKAQRKACNKYFTGAFTDIDKSKGNWILSNLLARREISQSMGYIGEETKEELDRTSSTASIDDVHHHHSKKNPTYKPKPSELREMNFWSPTSM